MPIQNKPRPTNESEAINKNIHPYPLLDRDNPNFKSNRGNDVSVRGDEFKEVTIELKDVYEAIVSYIKNKIQPTVVENGQQISVPVEYAFGDRWNEVQKNGFLRDKEGRVLLPLIIIKRDTVARNRSVGNKLDGNKVHLYQSFETRYTQKNQYDNFAILTNRIPVKQYHLAPVPDYVTITYNASILTNSQEQSDKVIQAFNFAENSYWGGESNRFQFSATIDSFTDTIEYSQGEDRSVRCNFNIVVNAYLLPDSVNRSLASQKKILSKATLKFNFITSISLSSVIPNIPPFLTNDFLVANGVYLINSNGLRLNLGPEVAITNDFLSMTNNYLVNAGGDRIKID